MEKVKSKTSAPNKLQRTVGKQKKTMARARRSLKRLALFGKQRRRRHTSLHPILPFPLVLAHYFRRAPTTGLALYAAQIDFLSTLNQTYQTRYKRQWGRLTNSRIMEYNIRIGIYNILYEVISRTYTHLLTCARTHTHRGSSKIKRHNNISNNPKCLYIIDFAHI